MKNHIAIPFMAAFFLFVGAGAVRAQVGQGGRVDHVLSEQELRAANEASQQTETDATGSEGYSLILKADASQYSLNQAVNVRLAFANVSRDIADVGYEPGLTFKLVIQRPDGTVAPLTTRGKQRDWIAHTFISGRSGSVIRGGAPWQESFQAVNYDFDMSQPGEYSLQVSREVPSLADPEKQVRIYSNVVNVTILSPQQQKQREARERQESAARLRDWLGREKSQLPPKDFALTISADQLRYAPGDRLTLDATLQNRGADVSFVDTPLYRIELMQADGALLPLTTRGQDAQGLVEPLFGAAGARVLRSGESETQHLDTAYLYDLQKPGDYFLRVAREVPRRDADDDEAETKTLYSNVLKFTIEAPKTEEPQPAK